MSSLAERIAAAKKSKGVTAPSSLAARIANAKTNKTAPQAKNAAPEPEYDSNWYDAPRAVLQGLTMGGADELGAGAAALGVKTADLLGISDNDASFGEVYDSMMADSSREAAEYRKANPKTALALEVGGGLLTGGVSGAKVLGSNAVKGLSKAKKVLAATGVGAAEGGLTGALSANQGNRVEGGLMGGTIGAALPLGLEGVAAAVKPLVNRNNKISDLVQPDGSFKPITLAAEDDSLTGTMYRDVVQQAFGGTALGRQAAPFIDDAAAAVNTAARNVSDVTSAGKRVLHKSMDSIKAQTAAQQDGLKAAFRQQALDAATPTKAPPELRDKLRGLNPQEAADQLDNYWVSNGFSEAKNKVFNLDADAFRKDMANIFDDPALEGAGGGYLADVTKRFDKAFSGGKATAAKVGVTSIGKKASAKGTMNGDDLMELRNVYARSANKADGLTRTAYRDVANRIDKMITDQLSGDDLLKYRDDMSRWEAFSQYKTASGKAGNKKGGLFDQDDWLSATKNYKLGKGKGVLQDEAQGLQQTIKQLNKDKGLALRDNPKKVEIENNVSNANLDLKDARTANSEIKQKAARKPQLVSRILATGLAGSPLTPFLGAGGLLTGAGVAKALSSEAAQKTIAKQTNAQKFLASMLRKGNESGVNDVLRIAPSGGVTAGINFEDEE